MGVSQSQPSFQRRIDALEARIRKLENEKRVSNAAITQNGLEVVDPSNDQVIARFGKLSDNLLKDDGVTPQYGIELYRDTGELAFKMSDPDPEASNGYHQFAAMYDRSGVIVMSDDASTGYGLATPWIPIPDWIPTDTSQWPGTTATAFTDMWQTAYVVQHPFVNMGLYTSTPAGATSEWKLVATVDGTDTQLGDTQSADAGIVFTSINAQVPESMYKHSPILKVKVRLASGSGTLRAAPFFGYGMQTQ